MTRLVKDGCFEILGIAIIPKDGQVTYQKGYTLKDKFQNGKSIISKFIDEHDIRYGGVSFKDINYGTFAGADITFKSSKLLFPKHELYITDCKNSEFEEEGVIVKNLKDKRFSKQSLHSYINDIDNPKSFSVITELVSNADLWVERINKIDNFKIHDRHFNYLKIIKKDYDELVYSNLFAYVFKKYEDIFIEFMDEVLNVKLSAPYSISREKKNIDLLVEDKNNIVIIENKIKSGINGVLPHHDFSENGRVQSQLVKYYEYGQKNKGQKKDSYFLFVPNYNKIDLKKYSGSKHYKVIRYSEIYNFFKKKKIKNSYFIEFVNALYKHTKDREVDYAEVMAMRFLDRIRKNS